MRTYLTIADNKQYSLLVRRGKFSPEELLTAWEAIVELSSEATGQLEYSTYKDLLVSYGELIAQYNVDKMLLLKLCLVVDDLAIGELRERGYNIATSGATAYAKSLVDAFTRSNNLVTRIEMKQKELKRFSTSVNIEQYKVTYEQILAQLNAALGFSVSENITLSAFHEYQRIIKRRNKPKQQRWD